MEVNLKELRDVQIKATIWDIEQVILFQQQNRAALLNELVRRKEVSSPKNEAERKGEGNSPA
jgi:hypothetical protein